MPFVVLMALESMKPALDEAVPLPRPNLIPGSKKHCMSKFFDTKFSYLHYIQNWGFTKNFVKALDKRGNCFKYIHSKSREVDFCLTV
jgi:hypothetical protein